MSAWIELEQFSFPGLKSETEGAPDLRKEQEVRAPGAGTHRSRADSPRARIAA
jgi:hypothetical protein